MGKVKRLELEKGPTFREAGLGSFIFSDDYSVFDWGRMPDALPGKGASLCMMSAYNFERMEEQGIPSHYLGVVEGGKTMRCREARSPSAEMKIRVVSVPELPFRGGQYDYAAYRKAAGEHFLVPLEVIFRNAVPVGSSLRKRVSPKELGLGMEEWPDTAVDLKKPIVEYTTKLEKTDRDLSEGEAEKISCLAGGEFAEVRKIALAVNGLVTAQAKRTGFVHEDGKIELLKLEGRIVVGDVAGTFDEDRFSFDGKQVSKEILRQYYKKTQPTWVADLARAKQEAARKREQDWKKFCPTEPRALDPWFKGKMGEIYQAGANHYTKEEMFTVPELREVLKEVYGWLEEK